MSDMKQLWDKFEADIKAKAYNPEQYFETFSMFRKGLDEQQIKLFERDLKKKLPNDFKEFLMVHDGYTGGKPYVIYQWNFYSSSKILKQIQHWADYNKYEVTPREDVKWKNNWIPIGDDHSGLEIAIDIKTNKIICFDQSEDPEYGDGSAVIANSFTDLIKEEFSNCLENFNKPEKVKEEKKKSWLDKIFGK